MRSLFLLLLFLLWSNLSSSLAGKSTDHTKNVQNSVRPLQIVYEGVLTNICTSWGTRINGVQYFVSAGHCVVPDEKMFVDNKPVTVVRVDTKSDLSLYMGGPRVDSLSVSFSEPTTRQRIFAIGYPYHATRQFAVDGIVSTPLDQEGLELYSMPSGPGMSGSPVVDEQSGMVVGLVQQVPRECGSFCPVSRGATVKMLRAFLYNE